MVQQTPVSICCLINMVAAAPHNMYMLFFLFFVLLAVEQIHHDAFQYSAW